MRPSDLIPDLPAWLPHVAAFLIICALAALAFG